jgi:V/A-type H+-transporting ATPase subunit C
MSRNLSQNYGYLNARLRARLASFIQPLDLRRLSAGTIRELELFLLDSTYAESYRAHLVSLETSPLARIEMAVSLGVAERIRATVFLSQGEPRELMKVVTTRSDLHNCRLVLRGLSLGRDPVKSPSWHAYGELGADFFGTLWTASSVLDAREKCLANGDPLALALGEALEARQAGESLPFAERHLLTAFLAYLNDLFRRIRGSGSDTAIEVLGRSVDLWNIGIWFRNHRERENSANEGIPFLPFGKWFSTTRLETSATIRSLVEGTPWMREIPGANLEEGSDRTLQGEFNTAFWRWQSFLYRRNLLGFEVAVSYLSRLLLEWQNLNILAVGLALGHPSTEISRRLIDVTSEERRS